MEVQILDYGGRVVELLKYCTVTAVKLLDLMCATVYRSGKKAPYIISNPFSCYFLNWFARSFM